MYMGALFVSFLLFMSPGDSSLFDQAIEKARAAIRSEEFETAKQYIDRALERDPKSIEAWALRTAWAEAMGNRDEWVYSLHEQYSLATAQTKTQNVSQRERDRILACLLEADTIAADLLALKEIFVSKLKPIADFYEEQKRPHSAIQIHQEILSLDSLNQESADAIARIASAPDPSLAESAQPKDLMEDVSEEWVKKYNKKTREWSDRAKRKLANYTTITNAGYEVLIRASEAMEQVNAFYRVFFNWGTPENDKGVPHIDLKIFRTQEEYQKLGGGVDWSAGYHSVGRAVVTYVGTGGFDSMITTLFHEAGHQFVHLATRVYSTTWLNEGLASYFEGCRILSNGTVQFNMPANHRLFPLAQRLEKGWMVDHKDGTNLNKPEIIPPKAPRLETIIANQYEWGPAWYAPTWGVTYFFFNYMDPVDGRFIYRKAFLDFLNQGGGRAGEGAVRNIEEEVLAHPAKPTKGVDFSSAGEPMPKPRTVAELNEVWKNWILRLRDEQSGKNAAKRPYHQWAKYAVKRKQKNHALEHFEKALQETPFDVDLLLDFARFLAGDLRNPDRASKLMRQAIRILELAEEVDEAKLTKADRLLSKWDPKLAAINKVHAEMSATVRGLAHRYLDENLPLMAMKVSGRYGTELNDAELLAYFEESLRQVGEVPWIWKLAYNENDLGGWVASGNDSVFQAHGAELHTKLGTFDGETFLYQLLTLDVVTSGDFSLEAEVYCAADKVNFCGLVAGKKGTQNCQAIVLFPGDKNADLGQSGYIDLASFYDDDSFEAHRHNPIKSEFPGWHTLRVDVAGKIVDVWFDHRLVVSHEYPNLDLLRGGLGLIAGTGESKYRNIRYLSLPARDPRARISRSIRMERLRKDSVTQGATGGINGSWLNMRAPWFEHLNWVQKPRTRWNEKGPFPTVLVFWSVEANEMVPIDVWLGDLQERYAETGLEVVSIVSAHDEETIQAYLEDHPFPGSVGVDQFIKKGYGEAFDQFGVGYRFNMPRIILLDVDQTVIWEGDPGFKPNKGFQEGVESYLAQPLADLVADRKLHALYRWCEEWSVKGESMLHEGDLEACARLLLESRAFDSRLDPRLKIAHDRLERLYMVLDSMESAAITLSREECEPALDALLSWGRLVDRKVDGKTVKTLRPALNSAHVSAWKKVMSNVNRIQRSLKPGKELTLSRTLLEKIDSYKGKFPMILRNELASAAEASDARRIREIIEGAARLPERWLAQEYLNW